VLEIKFGFWTRPRQLAFDTTNILPVPEHDSVVRGIRESGRVAEKWFHPPFTRAYDAKTPPDERPLVYQGSFGVKATHTLTMQDVPEAQRCGEFLIVLLGMLEGIRLIPETWNHFYRVAIEPNSLTDLVCDRREEETVLKLSQQFWAGKDDAARRLIFGAIHCSYFLNPIGMNSKDSMDNISSSIPAFAFIAT
jgi:hypothetical protein